MHWLVLLVLVVAEALAIRWWLARNYYPFIFNGWAPTLYSALLAIDLIIVWLISGLQTPGGTFGASLLALLGIVLVVIVVLGTLFFRWVVRLDMTDISEQDRR